MSKVYKKDEVVLGDQKIVEFKINPIIKFSENEELDEQENEQKDTEVDNHIIETANDIVEEAKVEADRILEKAQLEFDKIISGAQEERESIISEAYTKADEILEIARNEGYEKGLIIGEEKGFSEIDSLIEEAKNIKQDTLLQKKSMVKSLENEIIDLIIFCVKKVLNYELEKNDTLLLNLVKKGIEKCIYTDGLIIRVSTNDHELVNSSKDKIYMMTEGIDDIEVKKDPALENGSIVIETTSGIVNASLKTQINQIEEAFYDILKGE